MEFWLEYKEDGQSEGNPERVHVVVSRLSAIRPESERVHLDGPWLPKDVGDLLLIVGLIALELVLHCHAPCQQDLCDRWCMGPPTLLAHSEVELRCWGKSGHCD